MQSMTSKCNHPSGYVCAYCVKPFNVSELEQILSEAKLPNASDYKAHTMVLHITDGLLAFVGLMVILSVARESLPLIAGIVICAALACTSWANHASR